MFSSTGEWATRPCFDVELDSESAVDDVSLVCLLSSAFLCATRFFGGGSGASVVELSALVWTGTFFSVAFFAVGFGGGRGTGVVELSILAWTNAAVSAVFFTVGLGSGGRTGAVDRGLLVLRGLLKGSSRFGGIQR